MLRLSVCAVLFLSAAVAFGREPRQYPGQADALQRQEQNQSDVGDAVRACTALLVAATSVSCGGDTSDQQAQQQRPPAPQSPANPQDKSGINSQNQSDLRETLKACAKLLAAATSGSCSGEASQQTQPQQQPPQLPTTPQDKRGFNSQIQSNLQSDLASDPILSGTDVRTIVDDVNITLTGTVHTQAQLDRAMALASPYVQYRNMVNNVTIK